MRVYGLTGGIASGKSTVSRMLRELGAPIVDADVVAREVVQPGSALLAQIDQRFPGVVRPTGELDREALGKRVFADSSEREALNALIHPAIAASFEAHRRAAEAAGIPVLIYEAALLLENGIDRKLDGVALVTLPAEMQKARLMARDALSEQAATQRLAAQWPLAKKLPLARWVIDNSGSERETRSKVETVWHEMQGAPMLRRE